MCSNTKIKSDDFVLNFHFTKESGMQNLRFLFIYGIPNCQSTAMSNLHIEPQNDTFSYVLMLATFRRIALISFLYFASFAARRLVFPATAGGAQHTETERWASKSFVIKSALANQVFIFERKAFRFTVLTRQEHFLSHSNLNLWENPARWHTYFPFWFHFKR